MARLAAVGSEAFVVALAGVGAEPVRCEDTVGFAEALKRLALRKDVSVVFVPEPLAVDAPEAIAAFRARSLAALISLPLMPSDAHPCLDEMRKLVEQATGASLI